MRYINLTLLFDFIHVLMSKRKHSTQYEYFPTHDLFTTIYLLPKEILNHRNYFEQEINMINFV
jgi:inosine-uridine nucleoside N-ribohydrolase